MNPWWLLALVPIGLNLMASRAVLRAPLATPSQRRLQLALIWLLPAIGAVLCLVFTASQDGTGRPWPPHAGDGAGMAYAVLPADDGGACGVSSDTGGGCGGGDGGGGD